MGVSVAQRKQAIDGTDEQRARSRRVRRSAIFWVAVALAIYFGYIALAVWHSR